MRQSIHKLVIGSLLAGALAFSGAAGLSGAGGQVWHVPGDFPTIQGAVDAAAEGDTILVAPGPVKTSSSTALISAVSVSVSTCSGRRQPNR